MANVVSASAPPVLQEYYRILTGGPEAFGAGEGLRPLLSDHLDFTGSLAGHRPDAPDAFLRGVSGFIQAVQRIDPVQEVHDGAGSAVLYDAVMPGGVVRFAEFFAIRDGVIEVLDLVYDGKDYLAKGGR
ncbi:hypothetical protein [Gryllotalpicola ginsengisoli]|uniref:hypothetical protein n=1 Tax=Gryllotalpicola ginsengisoli TaxID=444608 RepID=UPI0003B45A5D|nr:hypothetical protein [Gryllotalpicola ginsengisoli]